VRNTICDLSSLPVNFWSTITIRFPDNNRLTHVLFFPVWTSPFPNQSIKSVDFPWSYVIYLSCRWCSM
jgi:hypothetical protein